MQILSKGNNRGSLSVETSLDWYSKGCWSLQGCYLLSEEGNVGNCSWFATKFKQEIKP